MKFRRTTVPVASAALILELCAVTGIAQAQDAAPADPARTVSESQPGPAWSDIIVTAQRRAESNIKVPVAITAFNQEKLAERRITTAQDLQGQVPSLTINGGGQTRSAESFTVRGQGTTFQSSPGVVTYLAEVPLVAGIYTNVQGVPGTLLDLSSLQVLRGPQGTLFGRNTTGGAILLEPAKPNDRFEGYVQAQFGNFNDREFEGVLNVPITADTLFLRVAARKVDRDGYTRDATTGRDYDDRHYLAGRVSLLWKPTESVENYLLAYGSRSHSNGSGYVNGGFNAPYINGIFAGAGGCAGVGLGANCSVLTALTEAQAARGQREVSLGGPTGERLRGFGISDTLRVDLSDTVTLRNIISYAELRNWQELDADGTTANIYNVGLYKNYPTDSVGQFSEEFQVQANSSDNKLNLTAGFYYDRAKTLGPNVLNARILLGNSFQGRSSDRQSRAIYAQGSLDFGALSPALDGLKLTAGGRYTWDKQSGFGSGFEFAVDGTLVCTNGVTPDRSVQFDEQCAQRNSYKNSAPTWTVGLDYSIGDHGIVYGKISRGYKSGGFNFGSARPETASFRPEFVTSYEAGIKSRWLLAGRPLLLNINFYHLDYKDIQRAAGDFDQNSGRLGTSVFNAAGARIRGIEFEGSVQPFKGLEISGSYSYADAKYGQYLIPAPFGQFDCTGQLASPTANVGCIPFQYTPKHQYNISGRYEFPVSEELGKISLFASYGYTGRQYSGPSTLPALEPGAFFPSAGLLNMSFNWRDIMQSGIDFSLFATNVTKERYVVSNTNVFYAIGSQASLYGEPRTYGLQLRYNWR